MYIRDQRSEAEENTSRVSKDYPKNNIGSNPTHIVNKMVKKLTRRSRGGIYLGTTISHDKTSTHTDTMS